MVSNCDKVTEWNQKKAENKTGNVCHKKAHLDWGDDSVTSLKAAHHNFVCIYYKDNA